MTRSRCRTGFESIHVFTCAALMIALAVPARAQVDAAQERTITFPADIVEELEVRGEAFLPGTGLNVRLAEGIGALVGVAGSQDEQLLIVDGVIAGLSTDENAANLMFSSDVEMMRPLGPEHPSAARFGRPVVLIDTRNAPGRPQAASQQESDMQMIVRTTSPLSTGPQPLIVVDGIIINTFACGANATNCLRTSADLGAEDIESIEVVKGAAASSLYGSKAAGGVISITTKRGRG